MKSEMSVEMKDEMAADMKKAMTIGVTSGVPDKQDKSMTFQKHWYLSILGLVGVWTFPDFTGIIEGTSPRLDLLNLLWLLWFLYFIPEVSEDKERA